MSSIEISSKKIIDGYAAFVSAVDTYQANQIASAVTDLMDKNKKKRSGFFGFFIKELTYAAAIRKLEYSPSQYRYSTMAKIERCFDEEKSIFFNLYSAAKLAEVVSVNTSELAKIARWLS